MLDDGLRTRTKGLSGLPVGGTALDLEGGSPRKNHGLGHTFGGGSILPQQVLREFTCRQQRIPQYRRNMINLTSLLTGTRGTIL
jgi:hypothetical protein